MAVVVVITMRTMLDCLIRHFLDSIDSRLLNRPHNKLLLFQLLKLPQKPILLTQQLLHLHLITKLIILKRIDLRASLRATLLKLLFELLGRGELMGEVLALLLE